VDTGSIERLAAVRWESGVLAGNPNAAAIRSLVSIAAERAPRVPDIQADIGSLLYRMGNPDKAAPFMRRAVELSPTMTNRVVTLMQDAGVEPATIADTLPRTTELLTLLREGLARSGHLEEWLQNVEEALPEHPQELLWTYTDACLAAHTEDRLLANVRRLGVLSERTAEAERQIAIGRAQLAQHAWTLAASAAAIATTLAPTDARMLDHAGQTAFSAGDLITAEAAFRGALHALALEDRRTHDRARMYRQHGQVLERLGRVDEALDDYRRAAELVPDDSWLRERLTGTSPSSLVDGRQ
jgi:tetratricopeptide (TPR) repeat protein